MNDNDLLVLDELNKGCSMGSQALNAILEKAEDKKFRDLVFELVQRYNKMSVEINKLHEKYDDSKAKDTSGMAKVMTWYGIQIRTITDSSNSKLAELTMQGLNMGIIEGRKFLNHGGLSKNVLKILNEYVEVQEEYVESFKDYL